AAGNPGLASTALDVPISTTAPDAPTGLGLDPASASGAAGVGTTNVTTPAVTGTAERNSTVEVLHGGSSLGTTTADNGGAWSFTPAVALVDGVHSLTATATDAAGNTGPASDPFLLAIDTVAPDAPTGLTLDPASDSGVPGDDLTNVTTPAITGSAEAGSTVEVF